MLLLGHLIPSQFLDLYFTGRFLKWMICWMQHSNQIVAINSEKTALKHIDYKKRHWCLVLVKKKNHPVSRIGVHCVTVTKIGFFIRR